MDETLKEIAQRLLTTTYDAHRALADSHRLAELVVELDKRAVSSGYVPGEWTTPSQAGVRQIVERLEYLLRVYVHAHESGSSVPPHIVAQARSLVKP